METQFQSLYNAIYTYKQSIVEILDKIDKNLLNAIRKYGQSSGISCQKKHILTMQMVETLSNYVQMLHSAETMTEIFTLKLSEIDYEIPVVQTFYSTNPFRQTNLTDLDDSDRIIKTEHIHDEIKNSLEINDNISDLMELLEPEAIQKSDVKDERLILESNENLDKVFFNTATRNNENSSLLEEENSFTTESEPILDHSTISSPTPDKKKTRQVTFKLDNEENETSQDLNTNIRTESSALTKLKQMPYFDRREEAIKALLADSVIEPLEWKKITINSQLRDNEKKNKEKNPIMDIPEDNLCVKDFCSFCFVQSPSEFYVRTNQQLFEKLETKLNEEMNCQKFVVNNFKSKEEARSNLGEFGVAYFPSKSKWYRIEILDWIDEEPEKIYIQLIDYGNKLNWTYKNVKCLSDFFSVFPKMAILCHLAGVYSPDYQNRTKWPKQSRKFFAALAGMDNITQFMVIFAHKEGDSYGVDLLKENDPNETTLGQILVETGHACQIQIEPDDLKEDDDFEELDNITEVITGYNAQDEARICPFTNRFGRCFKGPACKLEHGQLAKDGVTTDKIATMNQPLTTMALPLVGETVNIMITGYINTCRFYAHILTSRSNSNLYNDNFLQLMDTMKANNLVPTYERFKVLPGLAELVLVQEGVEWLRGTCIGYGDNEDIEIFLVDFGYKTLKKLKDLRQMKEDFLRVPFQAVECILDNCQEKAEITEETSKDFFERCMHMQIFQAIVVESMEPLRVQLWDSSSMDMRHVLKQYGIGEDQSVNFYPPQDYILSCH